MMSQRKLAQRQRREREKVAQKMLRDKQDKIVRQREEEVSGEGRREGGGREGSERGIEGEGG